MEQAMRKGKYHWGIRAERVAGASICIALREAGKAETVREVAVSTSLWHR
jgi:transcription initiation factor TFIIIB Brf1 subunit/transcription initiation factor TFIIB